MRMKRVLAIAAAFYFTTSGVASADTSGKSLYLTDCARCHGADGKGDVPGMMAVPGYRHVDLTQLSKDNDGKFPRQQVFDVIDGRKRILPHFIGDMPVWGLKYQQDAQPGPETEKTIKQKISALVGYIESIQEQ